MLDKAEKKVWHRLSAANPDDSNASVYGDTPRTELIAMMRHRPRRVIDLGCATGATGKVLKARDAQVWVAGIEPFRAAAKIARGRLDLVIEHPLEAIDFSAEGIANGSIDTLIMADVLEHLYDPWQALLKLRPLLSEDAQVLASIPNAQHHSIIESLANGDFPYASQGLLDITHIRFFTRRGVQRLFRETGYQIEMMRRPYLRESAELKISGDDTGVDLGRVRVRGVDPARLEDLRTFQFLLRASKVAHSQPMTDLKHRQSLQSSARNRVCVFAGYSAEGMIEPYVVTYLSGLRQVTDVIVYVADNLLSDDEQAKLIGLADYIIAEQHAEYDFGSYKRGIALLTEQGLLNGRELILCNDSCYGPINGFEQVFAQMGKRACDFWGMTLSQQVAEHIQSYFMVFSARVIDSAVFKQFIKGVTAQLTHDAVVRAYELRLTKLLQEAGFKSDTYFNRDSAEVAQKDQVHKNITVFPLFLLRRGMPLLKVKALYDPDANLDGAFETLQYLKQRVPSIYQDIVAHGRCRRFVDVKPPSLSVIVYCRDEFNQVERTLRSVLPQLAGDDQVIIIDDGSVVPIQKRLRRDFARYFASSQLRSVHLPSTLGKARARDLGLAYCNNDWVTYLNAGELCKRHALTVYRSVIMANPEASCVYAKAYRLSDGYRSEQEFDPELLQRENYIRLGVFVHKRIPECPVHATSHADDNGWQFIRQFTSRYPPAFVAVTTLLC